ncbi:DNA protecting protein DprA (plasmid) [Piscirickettsia salmonis]|uniref:DNA-processing protein DprA n=1 Tax=Piscirickettsia salmonis TaxID=1238 RepID=UPI0012D9D419|nr:DNA-processing protein DprA [Piscirickettsia salmonis]QGP57435.1 DNA protecting protein DprA [Piscirickettsia salmonis]
MSDNNATRHGEFWRREAIAFLALSYLQGVGFWTLHRVAKSGRSFHEFLKVSSPDELSRDLGVNVNSILTDQREGCSWDEFLEQLWHIGLVCARELKRQSIVMLFRGQDEFPLSLRSIDDCPFWIFVQGNKEILHKNGVAVVGTRKASDDGIFLTKLVVSSLVNKNIPIVSGLAKGIDQVAHFEAIKFGIPTIAVLGAGILVDYPKGTSELRNSIIEGGGCIITEYLPKQSYSSENFVRRNRIQAALSYVLVPTEWNIKSGTSHTVDYAYKYQRKIINVFLPNFYKLRPEIEFSEKKYSAVSCELPTDLDIFIKYIDGDLSYGFDNRQQDLNL